MPANTPPEISPALARAMEEISHLTHAIQTGVLFELEHDMKAHPLTPEMTRLLKHQRVGLNCEMVYNGALIKTLCEAGVITYDAYIQNQLQMMRQEVAMYTRRIRELTGNPLLTLG